MLVELFLRFLNFLWRQHERSIRKGERMPKQHLNQQGQIYYLLSFLTILVQRAGGQMTIEHLSEFSSSNLGLSMKLDVENDRVVLIASKRPNKSQSKPS